MKQKDHQLRTLVLRVTDDGVRALDAAVSALMNRTMEPWATHLRDISQQIEAAKVPEAE